MKNHIRILAFLLGIVMITALSACGKQRDSEPTLHWLKEESRFVDYEITDENTVKFRYSICFVNDTEEDATVTVSAKFNKKELADWVEAEGQDFFTGCDENGEMLYAVIESGEKKNVTVVFEGNYLGGTVNEALSFPEELMLMSK